MPIKQNGCNFNLRYHVQNHIKCLIKNKFIPEVPAETAAPAMTLTTRAVAVKGIINTMVPAAAIIPV